MKILFVYSGNKSNGIGPIIQNQANSIKECGIEIDYFPIVGKGLNGYYRATKNLRTHLMHNNYHVFHAHYSLSGIVCSLSGCKPLIVSLMGSDLKQNTILRYLVAFFQIFYWKHTIVKSKDMFKSLVFKKSASIIPNGVNLDKFRPIDKKTSVSYSKYDDKKINILFAANPKRPEKNYMLAKNSFDLLKINNKELHTLENIPNELMPYYYNSSDVVLLTSKWEGSPNVIKEAMACNRPIVTTNVGDVNETIGNTQGCFITENDKNIIAEKIKQAISYTKGTNGRNNIQHLDEKVIASKIILLYKKYANYNHR